MARFSLKHPAHRLFAVAFLLAAFFLARAAGFAARYGGIEHDSGWYLTIAQNLAKRGIFATRLNTVVVPDQTIATSVHGRPSIQDAEGNVYSPGGVSVGPGYMFPQALFLRVFGNGWWSYRAWALATYFGLFFLLFLLAGRWGGMRAQLFLAAWLWSFPSFHIGFSFDCLAEHVAMFYFLLALWIFRREGYKAAFAGGFCVGLAVETKLLFFLGFAGFMAAAAWEFWRVRRAVTLGLIYRWHLFVAGFLIPIVGFEIYQAVDLIVRFYPNGGTAWVYRWIDQLLLVHEAGSGLRGDARAYLLAAKLGLIREIGFSWPIGGWLALAAGAAAARKICRFERQSVYVALLGTVGIWLFWFLAMSPNAYTRHVWAAYLLLLLTLASALGAFLSRLETSGADTPADRERRWLWRGALTVAFLLLFNFPKMEGSFAIPQAKLDRWHAERFNPPVQGMPANPIFPLEEQKQLVRYFQTEISPEDRVYYLSPSKKLPSVIVFMVAEAAALTGRILFPLGRYEALEGKNPSGGRSLLLFGPYMMGGWPWQIVPAGYDRYVTELLCREVLFRTRSYQLCEL